MPSLEEGASLTSSSVSLLKTIIGAGLMSIPLSFSTDGYIFGSIIIIFAALTSGFGLFLQAYVSKFVPRGHATFFNLCSITYPSLSVVFDLAIAIQCFGCAISYLVLVGDLMPTIVEDISFVDESNYSKFWVLASSVICVPLSLLKNLDSLKYTSILGLGAIAYLTLLVVFEGLFGDFPNDSKGDLTAGPPTVSGVFSTFSIIVFAFTGHQNMFSIINEARDKSLSNLTKLITFAISLSTGLFILVGLTGYFTFGNKVGGNIVLSYPSTWATTLGRFAIVFMVIFSFPLMIHPARISVNNIYYWFKLKLNSNDTPINGPNETSNLLEDQNDSNKPSFVVPFPNKVFYTISVSLLLVGYYLAVTVKSFALVLAIVGATGSTAISFILPGLFGYTLVGSDVDVLTKKHKTLKNASLFLVIWGFVVMVLCLYVSLVLDPA